MLTFEQAKQLILEKFSTNPNQDPMTDWVIYHNTYCKHLYWQYDCGEYNLKQLSNLIDNIKEKLEII